jgi:hypothetical protein
MSTHALIGVKTPTGYKARFVHYDGYTEAMLPAIKRCIQNHKVAGNTFTDARNYMLGNHWSSFNISEHRASEAHSHSEVWYTESIDIDAQYLYILDDNEVTCYINLHDKWIAIDPSNTIQTKVNA